MMPTDVILAEKTPSEVEELTKLIHRRQLSTPLLLFLASHQSLAFVTGQVLYALMPMGLLLGWESIGDWAAFLSSADAGKRLAALLTTPSAGFLSQAEQTAE
jgi:hypothetical protein